MGEFDLIARYFTRPAARAVLGVGDDCALLQPSAGHAAGHLQRHAGRGPAFFCRRRPGRAGPQGAGRQPERPGRLRRHAAGLHAGAGPARAPTTPGWTPFSRGLLALADAHGCELVGGDTTQGPLNICITVFGEVPVPTARARRCCARAPGPATISMSAARWAMPGWRSRRCAARCRLPRRAAGASPAAAGAAHAARRAGPGAARRGVGGARHQRRPAGRPAAHPEGLGRRRHAGHLDCYSINSCLRPSQRAQKALFP